eukprot:7981935-Pyramimonas_sp.AAC.1
MFELFSHPRASSELERGGHAVRRAADLKTGWGLGLSRREPRCGPGERDKARKAHSTGGWRR